MNTTLHRQHWFTLFAMISCTSIIFLNTTALPVAIPTIKANMDINGNIEGWIINSYFLLTATLVFAGGKFSDIFGRRRIFCIGMGIFVLASLLGSASYTGMQLAVVRAIQGIGAALMGPASMALLIEVFPEGERGKAVGILVSISSLFLSFGSFLGGALSEMYSWRGVFLLNVPIGICGIILAMISLPVSEKRRSSFDIPGFLSLTMCIASITLCLMEINKWRQSMGFIFFWLALSLLFFGLFLVFSKFTQSPFVDFSLFQSPTFKWGNMLIFSTQFFVMITVFWPIFFQNILHMTPLQTGFVMLGSTFPTLICAPIGGVVSDKLGPKIPTQVGFSLIVFAFLWMSFFNPSEHTFRYLIPSLICYGCGISLVMTPIATVTLSCFSRTRNGEASGIYNTVRFTGATIGVAFFGTIMTLCAHSKFTQLAQRTGLYDIVDTSDIFQAIDRISIENIPGISESQSLVEVIKSNLSDSLAFAFTLGNLSGAIFAMMCLFVVTLKFAPPDEREPLFHTKTEINF